MCVVFDIDDTLYLERDYVRSGFRAVGSWVQRWLRVDGFESVCWREFEAGAGRRYSIRLSRTRLEPARELISGLVELYRTHDPCIRLAGDASQAIRELAARYPIAVISDGPVNSQSRKADALGLRGIAAPVILTEAYGQQFRKPHTRAFREVARVNVPAERYISSARPTTRPKTLRGRTSWAGQPFASGVPAGAALFCRSRRGCAARFRIAGTAPGGSPDLLAEACRQRD